VAATAASDIAGYSAVSAATLVGVMGLFNGGGRVFWGWLSTHIGRMIAFLCMLGVQAVCFLVLPHSSSAVLFAVLTALVYLCYGGGFGTMPATAGDFFGLRNAGAVYGLMIVGWSIGGVAGPLLVAALINGKSYTVAFTTIGIIAAVALVPSLLLTHFLPGNQVSFSGTSILIAVGVALETMKQIDSQLMMRNYEGFLK